MAKTMNVLVFLLVLVVGGILLQIALSKQESKWPGLVLPGLCGLYSLLMLLSIADLGDLRAVLVTTISILLLCNIPTVVLLAIYAACREKRKKHREIDRMRLDDL